MPWRTGIYNDNSPETVRSIIGWTCFILLIGYVCFNVFLPNNDLNVGLDAIIWVLSLYVVLKYLHQSILTILSGTAKSPEFLVVGITISWMSQSGRAAGGIVTRLSGFDIAWLNGEYFGLIKLLTIIAAVCHVISAGAIQLDDGQESVPKKSTFGFVVAFLLAISLATFLVVKKPDLKPWIERMPSWSKDMFQTGRLLDTEKHG